MRGLLTASYWLGLPACTAGVHLTQQLSDQNDKQLSKLEPGYDILCCEEIKPPVAGATLKQVQVLFRHGARTPLTRRYWDGSIWDDCGDAYTHAVAALRRSEGLGAQGSLPGLHVFDKRTKQPQEEFIDGERLVYYQGGCTRGELTKVGQRQALDLGRWLRHRYVTRPSGEGLLPANFDGGLIHAHSTNYRRTRGTMHGVLLGLYPDNASDIPVQTSTHLEEVMLAQVTQCSQLGAWYKSVREYLAHDDRTNAVKVDAGARIRKRMGLSLDDEQRLSWTELHDAMTSMRAHGQRLPDALTEHDLDIIDSLATARVVQTLQNSADPTVLGLALGRLLSDIEELIDHSARTPAAGAAGGGPPRMWLWSGHDTTIIPVLLMLGQDVTRWPPYTSSVVLELWEDTREVARGRPVDDRHFVRVLFNGREVAVPAAAADDPQPATLAAFKRHVMRRYALTADDHAAACEMPEAQQPHAGAPVDTSAIM